MAVPQSEIATRGALRAVISGQFIRYFFKTGMHVCMYHGRRFVSGDRTFNVHQIMGEPCTTALQTHG